MQKKFLALSFIEGAAVMAAELCGAKLLAPIYGSSLYVWASVLGITLVALAGGYFFGGLITEKSKLHNRNLFFILIAASLFIILMPVISHYLVPRISYMSFLPAVVVSTFTLLFFPVFFLGATSPLFIILQTDETNTAGRVSGTVYAVSTVGGIFATFFCGFYLIPETGLNVTLLSFGILLFIGSILVFKIFRATQFLLPAAFLYLNLQFTFKPSSDLMVSDSILGHLQVQDVADINGDSVRILKINNIIQTEMNLKSKKSVSGYISLLDSLIAKQTTPSKALVLGLGGGLTANLLVEKNYNVTGVEFDERIIKASEKYFFLNNSVVSLCEDARYYLNHCEQKFDLVLVDVFKAEEQPSHVLTSESLERLKINLNDSAVVYINWHGYTNPSLGQGTAILYNTLKNAGFKVQLTAFSDNEDYRNVIFVCSLTNVNFVKENFGIDDKLMETSMVNSDNNPLLEKYNAKANKVWRKNYLRFYQNQ